MKAILFTLTIFAGTALATQAQSKMETASTPMPDATETNIGPGKFNEVEPISYVSESNKKKVRLKTNNRRTEPVMMPATVTPAVAGDSKTRVEGKLADNSMRNAEAPAFK